MRIGTLFLIVVGCATLVGCSSRVFVKPIFNPFARTVPCTTRDCSLPVTVTENASTRTCDLDVAEYLNVQGGPSGQRSLTWTIGTDGYQFSRESYKYGIFIKTDPGDEFKNVQITGNGKSLSIQFNHQRTGIDYGYALTVRRSDGSFCNTLDPWLIS